MSKTPAFMHLSQELSHKCFIDLPNNLKSQICPMHSLQVLFYMHRKSAQTAQAPKSGSSAHSCPMGRYWHAHGGRPVASSDSLSMPSAPRVPSIVTALAVTAASSAPKSSTCFERLLEPLMQYGRQSQLLCTLHQSTPRKAFSPMYFLSSLST